MAKEKIPLDANRVLLVDDEDKNIRYLSLILEENGFGDVLSAADGDQALKMARQLLPDLVVLDIRMPKKNGIEVFNELKKDPALAGVKVIFLTGESEFLYRLAQHESGGAGLRSSRPSELIKKFTQARPEMFLEKPIEPDDFINAVIKVLA